jgi:hypothetical protein
MKYMPCILAAAVFVSGCATAAPEVKIEKVSVQEKKVLTAEDFNYENDVYVVSAKKLTKLEKRKLEAIRVNDRETTGVFVAAIVTVTSFSVIGGYLVKDMDTGQGFVFLGAAAAGAYVVSFAVQYIYEMFNPKIR